MPNFMWIPFSLLVAVMALAISYGWTVGNRMAEMPSACWRAVE